MKIVTNIFHSSLGRKYIMAVTGFALFGFVVAHLVGNLQIFLGPEAINRYGAFLQGNQELLWPARVGLLVIVSLHIWAAASLTRENSAARPIAYAEYKPKGSTYASRTMLMSGLIIAAFIIYHLLHYTVEAQFVNGTGKDFSTFTEALPNGMHRHDIFKMMVVGFSNPLVSGFYLLSMALLCLHLSHGTSSMFQSIGWTGPAYRSCLDRASRIIALLIFLGYSSIPVAILLGYGKGALK